MDVTITFDINLQEIDAWDTAIKAYMNHREDWHDGIDESTLMVDAFSKAHTAYLQAYTSMRMITPILGDWVVLERDSNHKVVRAEFVQDGGPVNPAWVQNVISNEVCRFELLYAGEGNDYREWELVTI
jgi:hypothetical protein